MSSSSSPGREGVFDRCLRPHLTSPDIDAAPDAEGVAFDDAGQLLKLDGQGASSLPGRCPELRLKLVGQLIIPIPASLPQARPAS
ncbi:MAG: hypothetical protein JO286_26290 [Solirubrobacterales bacterium]|nr:hypothetical protein [Solirubrobacterales bacterium]